MRFPRALRWSVSLFVAVWLPVWWIHLGPANFLWFSDLALLAATLVLWRPGALVASAAALAVLIPEIAWNLDFAAQLASAAPGIGLATYMFEPGLPLHVRVLSGTFHVALPPLLLYEVWRLGYDRRALLLQTLIAWLVLPLSRALATPESNLNWTHGLGAFGTLGLSPGPYLALLMLAFPLVLYVPTHLVLARLGETRR